MEPFRELLACPACAGPIAADWSCRDCGRRVHRPDGIPDLRVPGNERTEAVRRFYDRAPFPGYPARDTLQALHSRADGGLGMRRLVAQTAEDNVASNRVLDRLGFTIWGRETAADVLPDGRAVDALHWELLRD